MSEVLYRRGSLWGTDDGRVELVVSSTAYNQIVSEPTVLTMPVLAAEPATGFGVNIGGEWALPTLIGTTRKDRLVNAYRQVDTQALTDVNNMLFKVLATPE